ncbi:MAG: hypothetical protein DI573_09760 [Microbacterium sp.]|jgi:hypothetical protein|uniref:hypothetical protein n=1 Tax=unclassified Microbacterium TaxID=2609290 RepID=UPI000DB1B536|nr:hypothetical protein [Microbacterium sp.]PZU38462.1 MAG: hypothetical protein DI573_09760 [Microbacterium sp.]
MEEWVGEAAEQLERITRDPMADAAHGAIRVVSVSAPTGHARYQELTVQAQVSALGIEEKTQPLVVVLDTRRLPPVGAVLPARISRTHEGMIEVDWESLAR